MKHLVIYFLFQFFVASAFGQQEGKYEFEIPGRVKEIITLSANQKYSEVEYRWRQEKWVLKCTYSGTWHLSGDTLITKPTEVVWSVDNITPCREKDDTKQPMCCFSRKFSYDENSLWLFGPISKTKYVYTKKK